MNISRRKVLLGLLVLTAAGRSLALPAVQTASRCTCCGEPIVRGNRWAAHNALLEPAVEDGWCLACLSIAIKYDDLSDYDLERIVLGQRLEAR